MRERIARWLGMDRLEDVETVLDRQATEISRLGREVERLKVHQEVKGDLEMEASERFRMRVDYLEHDLRTINNNCNDLRFRVDSLETGK